MRYVYDSGASLLCVHTSRIVNLHKSSTPSAGKYIQWLYLWSIIFFKSLQTPWNLHRTMEASAINIFLWCYSITNLFAHGCTKSKLYIIQWREDRRIVYNKQLVFIFCRLYQFPPPPQPPRQCLGPTCHLSILLTKTVSPVWIFASP